MHVEGDIQLLQLFPERQIDRIIQILVLLGYIYLRKAVHQNSNAAQFLNAAMHFLYGLIHILHGKSRKPLQAIWQFGNGVGHDVIGLFSHGDRFLAIGDALNRGRVERKDHHVHAVFVHLINADL